MTTRPRRRNLADRLRPLRRIVGRIEVAQIRRFGRSGLSVAFRRPVLVLETTGRRSGRIRRTPLAYAEVDGAVIVVGGAGGQTAVPDWVANLRADPHVRVLRPRSAEARVARELTGTERQAAWDHVLALVPAIATYEARAGRPIPVIALER